MASQAPPLEDRLRAVCLHMAGLAQAGEPSRAEDAVAKEVEECAEELRVMVRLPMRRHKEWVAYLTGLLATLSETADAVEELIRQARRS